MENGTKKMRASDTILANLLDAVLVVNSSGDIIYANRAAEALFAQSAGELVGSGFGFPIFPEEVQEIELVKGGKLLTVQMLASQIEWEGATASLLSLRDITSQKLVQQELARQRLLLEKTNEENASYASLASHDLKEPIRKILIFSDRILGNDRLPEEERTQLQKIRSSAKRMHSLISGIAELSKITFVKHVFAPVDLNKVLEEVQVDLELQIEEKEALIQVGDLPVIDAIEGEMHQLFLNLISNALKYSREGVKPVINVREADADGGFVCIECADNGIGFDNASGLKLFQPFQRLHSTKYEGMGIGLALCQRIVDVHNGQITAEGEPGVGATFRIRLPRHQLNEESGE